MKPAGTRGAPPASQWGGVPAGAVHSGKAPLASASLPVRPRRCHGNRVRSVSPRCVPRVPRRRRHADPAAGAHGGGGGAAEALRQAAEEEKSAAGAEEAAELCRDQRPGRHQTLHVGPAPGGHGHGHRAGQAPGQVRSHQRHQGREQELRLQTLPDPRGQAQGPREGPHAHLPALPAQRLGRRRLPGVAPPPEEIALRELRQRHGPAAGARGGGAGGAPRARGAAPGLGPRARARGAAGARRSLPQVGLVPRAPPAAQREHSVRARRRAEPRAAALSLRSLRRHHRPLHGHAPELCLCHLREDGIGRPGHGRAERRRGPGRAAQGQHRPQAAHAGRGHRKIALGVPGREEQRQRLAQGQALAGRVQ